MDSVLAILLVTQLACLFVVESNCSKIKHENSPNGTRQDDRPLNDGWSRGERDRGGRYGGDRYDSRDGDWDNSRDSDNYRNRGGWSRGRGNRDNSCRFLRCYADTPGNRLLRGLTGVGVADFGYVHGQMTTDMCIEHCDGFKYAGLEFGSYCYCGNRFHYRPQPSESCNTDCPGDRSETCGGFYAIEVYRCYGSRDDDKHKEA